MDKDLIKKYSILTVSTGIISGIIAIILTSISSGVGLETGGLFLWAIVMSSTVISPFIAMTIYEELAGEFINDKEYLIFLGIASLPYVIPLAGSYIQSDFIVYGLIPILPQVFILETIGIGFDGVLIPALATLNAMIASIFGYTLERKTQVFE